jgi:hypothetical protein
MRVKCETYASATFRGGFGQCILVLEWLSRCVVGLDDMIEETEILQSSLQKILLQRTVA